MAQGLFDVDPDFCSYCGTFLTIKARSYLLTCENCGANFDICSSKYSSQVQTITFATAGADVETIKKSTVDALTDKTCPKCGSPEMSFKTLQTRSADEGQTVYYTCKKCNHSEFEYA